MSNSKLVDYTKISPNKTSPRNHKIDTITIHCVVGQCSVETLGNVFAPTSRQASSNYGIGYDGRIGMYVEEKDRSWCSSSASNDNRAITIEVASDTKHPYKVRDAAYKALIDLCTDICKRNGIKELKWKADKSLIGKVEQQNMTVHRWFANKACPGDYLYNLHGQIAAEVNARLGVVSDTTPDTNAALEYAVGDVVTFKGTKHYASSNDTNGKTCKPGEARVTSVAKNGKHQYHLIKTTGSASTVYGWVDAADITNPDTNAALEYAVGDVVTFKGTKHYASSNDTNGKTCKPGEARVTSVAKNGKHQYHLIKTTGSASTVYGWVDAADITKASASIAKGSKVKVNKGAKTYTGGSLASFVYSTVYTVMQIDGDRVVIGKDGVVTAAVNIKNLTLVG